MSSFLYFAYGSNMSSKRLVDRVSSSIPVDLARLESHRLRFHKIGQDGSAKCDAEYTGNPEDFVEGVLYRLDSSEKTILDHKEGLGFGYAEKQVNVKTRLGRSLEAMTYFALRVDPHLKPFHWYKQHVLIGARENGLPDDYVRRIESVDSIDDTDSDRHQNEMAIYR
jgi:cation transport regulator ChaC